MKHLSRFAAAPAALLLAFGLVACGSDEPDSDKSKETPSASPTSTSPSSDSSSEPTEAAPTTIPEYLAQEGIEQTQLTRDTDELTVDLPVPDGWSSTEDYADLASYGAIVLDAAADPSNPPRILGILARLDGDADPAKILEYAPGELEAIDGFTPTNMGGDSSTLGGFDAVQIGGTYTDGGQELLIAQKTVVIPGDDALYVLQLNAYALSDEVDALIAALETIDAQTTITP
ncbi:MAG: LpqN/LpqT family lipoprotein [Propionibacteriales bacterium]|nr:LpqN/LpqT family lipoprotein [Propionibacteriales bacterium]